MADNKKIKIAPDKEHTTKDLLANRSKMIEYTKNLKAALNGIREARNENNTPRPS